ncbi:MAG: hypothetical protein MI865_09770 [Proteobacteria bacterium]|nr:hypothetical protein [Pseudomonadota bacterium]
MRILSLILVLAINNVSAKEVAIDEVVLTFDMAFPKQFGVLVGDVIKHEFELTTQGNFFIDESSLPKKGSINYWLDVREVIIKKAQVEYKNRYSIMIEYQTFYAPLVVTERIIPAIQLHLYNDKTDVSLLTIPSWKFYTSPLKPVTQRGIASKPGKQLEPLGDYILTAKGMRYLKTKMSITGLCLILILLLYLWSMGFFITEFQSPFQKACKKIAGFRGDNDKEYREVIRLIHHAFNVTRNETVFASSIDAFIKNNPEYEPLLIRIKQFFRTSAWVFYGQQLPDKEKKMSMEELKRFCHDMSGKELLSLQSGKRD